MKVSEPGSPVVNPAYSIASKRIDSQKLICAPCLVLRRLVAVAMPSTARDKMLMVLMFYSVISVYLECMYQRNNNHCKQFVNADHLLMFPWHSRRERGSDLPSYKASWRLPKACLQSILCVLWCWWLIADLRVIHFVPKNRFKLSNRKPGDLLSLPVNWFLLLAYCNRTNMASISSTVL